MTSCSDIDPKMTAYVDGELSGSEAAAVDAHVAACDACRERSRVERAARTVVRRRAASLTQPAPASLEARCRTTALAGIAPTASRWRGWRAPLSLAAAALLVVAATFAFLRPGGQPGTVVAAELALDHAKCFALVGDLLPSVDRASLEQSFERTYGWRADIPAGLQAQGVELLQARRCAYHDGQMAHVLCRLHGQPMSLFVLPQGERASNELESVGQQVVIWGADQRTYALVGQQAWPDLRRVASSIRRGTVVVP